MKPERLVIGHYELLSPLGVGGMGEVYFARDTRLDRRAALKILPAQVAADRDRIERFVREAKTASALNHPNIATIYDVGQVDGTWFIAMEYVEGQTLAQRLGRGSGLKTQTGLPPSEVLAIGIQIAEALEVAHTSGITHRDVKPENVMLRPDGYVKVLDFGLAKLTERPPLAVDPEASTIAPHHTEAGVVLGTVGYMSPEQARGQKVDARTDIFSLGVVLYEMACGRRPFDGATSIDVLAAILNSDAPPLAARTAAVPDELDRIVKKALRKDRNERYQTVKDLLVDLRSLQTGPGSRKAVASRFGPYRAVAGIAAALAISIASVVYFSGSRSGPAIESVAVLPFAHMGADDTEYLADGITESITSNLSQLSGLRVMSRTSVFRYKGRDIDPQAAGRELNVQAVLAGRVEPRGDQIAISLELVDVRDSRQLWGEQYTEKLGDFLRVQGDISREVSEKLRLRLTGTEQQQLTQRPTQSAEAYRLYLKGRFSWRKLTEEGLTKSIDYFLQALQKDPAYALAYVALAESYITLGTDMLPPREAMPKAAAYAKKALDLNERLPGAHAAMGIVRLVYDWDWQGAARELRYDQALKSESVESFTCALHYADPLGRNGDAIAALQSALAADPLSLPTNLELGCASYYGRYYDQAIRQFQGTLTLYPDHPVVTYEIGRAFAQKKMYAEARTALSKVKTSSGDWPPIVAELAYAYAASGKRAEAQTLLKELSGQAAHRFVDPYLFAQVQTGLGDKDQSFAWLDKAVTERSGWLPWLKVEPKWDSLRTDPRFTDLLRRVGLPL